MNKLSRAFLGAAIGMAAGMALSFVSLPAANRWMKYPGSNDPFTGNYLPFIVVGALHGAICGFIIVRSNKRAIAGGIVGLIIAVGFSILWAVGVFVYKFAFILPNDPGAIIYAPASLFMFMFYAIYFLVMLAIPSVVHGILIGFLTSRFVKRSSQFA